MNCSLCFGRLIKTTKPIRVTCLDVKLVLRGVERQCCPACGEEFFNPEEAANFEKARKLEYAKQTTLNPVDVVRIRKKLGLSQAELEEKLGLGSKVIVRWENGKVRLPGPVNALLKILDKHPEALKFA